MNSRTGLQSLVITLLVACLFIRCSNDLAGGGTEDVNTMIAAGYVFDSQGEPAAGTNVLIVKSQYNPVTGGTIPDSFITVSDDKGAYHFHIPDSGMYNIYAFVPASGKCFLHQDIHITKGTVNLSDTLQGTGAIRITLPDTADPVNGYVYVPGSPLVSFLSKEILLLVNGKYLMIFDSLPACHIKTINYGERNSVVPPVTLTNSVVIIQGDTIGDNIKEVWSSFTTANSGLPQNAITCSMVDKDGILWAGTPGSGLAIFNGSTWQICNTKTSMLPHDSVLSINQDYTGSIWIGTAKGLVRVQNSVWSVFKKESTVAGDNRISGIACTRNGNKWFSSGYGCWMYDNTTWHQMVMIGSIALRAMHAVAADRNDYVSWASEYGLFQSDPIDSLHEYIPIFDDNTTFTEITDIAIDKKNVRWMASAKGIISYTGSAWKLYTVANSGLPSNSISSIAVDHNDAVWAGIKAGSSVIKISNSIKVYYPDNAVVLKDAGTVNDISVDRKNSIYFATEKGGLIQLTFISVPE